MPSSNPLLWPKAHMIWGYGIAVLSVTTALIIARLPAFHLEAAPVSLFLCAIMFTAWFGGVGPGLLATALSALAFHYYFLPPMHSLAPKTAEIPRIVIFTVSALTGARSESTDCRCRHQRQYLFAMACGRQPKSRRGARRGHENRERRNACGGKYQTDPSAF